MMPEKRNKLIATIILLFPCFVLAQHAHRVSHPVKKAVAFSAPNITANYRVVNLNITYKWVNFSGHWQQAIAVNDQIPGPTLHFNEGDHVTINVYNRLDKPTTIHWHGILVPWQMDGVEGVSQKGIEPGCVFHYRFTLHQSGTYWYHAHAGLQEQEGLYGAFIIDPPKNPYRYRKDYPIVLSDWSNSRAEQVLANLKKTGDYYAPCFPLQPSLTKFLHDYHCADENERTALIQDYKQMQNMRMSIYDFSDIAYDAYLLNGATFQQPWQKIVKKGDVVRLRFIGAMASTIYRVKIFDAPMTIIHIQGNDVVPHEVHDFTIAPGETTDVLIKIKENKPYVIYAESNDTLGKAIGILTSNGSCPINLGSLTPFPEPIPTTREMMNNSMAAHHEHGSHDNQKSMNMNHSMKMPTEPTQVGDFLEDPKQLHEMSHGTKYQNLVAVVRTNDPHKTIDKVIRMELFGYMDRFIWMINGLPEYRAQPIILKPNKRYRIIFTNNSMMHHPMHIHGHWFILRNGHAEFDPLLHTLDVAPGAKIVADIDTDASGQWFFHCHHLYHMVSGMSRVFQYHTIIELAENLRPPEKIIASSGYYNRPIIREDEVLPLDRSLIAHPMVHGRGFYFANFLDIGADPFHNVQELTFRGLYGSDYNKLQLYTEDAEINKGEVENADIDIFYWHLLNQFWAIKGGMNYFYQPSIRSYWQPGLGIEGVFPWFIETNLRTYYHNGAAKFDLQLERDTQITDNFLIALGVRSILATKTVYLDQVGSGLNQMRYTVRPYYRVMPGLFIYTEYEHDQNYGAFKTLRSKQGDSATEDTLTFGISLIL